MKQITAIIQPHMLAKVEHALRELAQFPGFTVLRAKGHGRPTATADGKAELAFEEHDKLLLLMFCSDATVSQIVATICENADTGLPGDGVIAVTEAIELVRIRTGEHGEDAV